MRMGLLFTALTPLGLAYGAETIVVDCTGAGRYTEIQLALNAAADGDTVLVKPGVYEIRAPIDFNPGPISPPKNVKLVSEAGPDHTTIRMADPPANRLRSSIMIFESGESGASLVEGFTLTGGEETRWGVVEDWMIGGGAFLILDGSSPTIRKCVITENASTHGAGMMICNNGSSPRVSECVFSDNLAHQRASMIYLRRNASVDIRDCTFVKNTAVGFAGIYAWEGTQITITNSEFSQNYSETAGAIRFFGCKATMVNCTLWGNMAPIHAGAVNCNEGSDTTLINCTITGNSAGWGGGVFIWDEDCTTRIHNCILWDNSAGAWIEKPGVTSDLTVTYSCIDLPEERLGEGSFNRDPRFGAWGDMPDVYVDSSRQEPGDGTEANPFRDLAAAFQYDHRLAKDSPCLGAGEEGVTMGALDRELCETPGATRRTVHVAEGTYSIRGFTMAHNVSMVGAGRDETVIEGTVFGLRTGALVSDLTVTRGTSGGIPFCAGEDSEVRNLIIRGNRVVSLLNSWGGGMSVFYTDAKITNCKIIGNEADNGGGLAFWGCTPTLTNCIVAGNKGTTRKGGLFPYGSALIVFHIGDDTAPTCPILQSCTITGNTVRPPGTAPDTILIANGFPRFSDCIITGARRGVALETVASVWIRPDGDNNDLLISARIPGPDFNGVKIVFKESTQSGDHAIVVFDGAETLTITIDPTATTANTVISAIKTEGTFTAALDTSSEEGNDGTGLIGTLDAPYVTSGGFDFESNCLIYDDPFDASPRFVDLGVFDFDRYVTVDMGVRRVSFPDFVIREPDYHLQADSPALDAGASGDPPAFDFDMHPRPCGTAHDIGAYEDCAKEAVLAVSSASLENGENASVYVSLSNWAPVEGFSFGIAHDPTIAVLTEISLADCPVMEGVNHGAGPDFFFTHVDARADGCPSEKAGGTIECVVSLAPVDSQVIPPGTDQRIARLTYHAAEGCRGGDTSPLNIVGCLSHEHAVPLQVTLRGEQLVPKETVCGELVCGSPPSMGKFRRGDANDDGRLTISDAVLIFRFLFGRGRVPPCHEAANPDDDDRITIGDGIYILNYLFRHGQAPLPPGPATCGFDPADSPSQLGCESYTTCRDG